MEGTPEYKIRMNDKERVIRVNTLLRPDQRTECSEPEGQWCPPMFQYYYDDNPAPATRDEPPAAPQSGQPVTTRSGRVVRPIDYYGY